MAGNRIPKAGGESEKQSSEAPTFEDRLIRDGWERFGALFSRALEHGGTQYRGQPADLVAAGLLDAVHIPGNGVCSRKCSMIWWRGETRFEVQRSSTDLLLRVQEEFKKRRAARGAEIDARYRAECAGRQQRQTENFAARVREGVAAFDANLFNTVRGFAEDAIAAERAGGPGAGTAWIEAYFTVRKARLSAREM